MQKCFGENPEVYGAYLDAFERYSLNPYPLNRKDSLAPSFRNSTVIFADSFVLFCSDDEPGAYGKSPARKGQTNKVGVD